MHVNINNKFLFINTTAIIISTTLYIVICLFVSQSIVQVHGFSPVSTTTTTTTTTLVPRRVNIHKRTTPSTSHTRIILVPPSLSTVLATNVEDGHDDNSDIFIIDDGDGPILPSSSSSATSNSSSNTPKERPTAVLVEATTDKQPLFSELKDNAIERIVMAASNSSSSSSSSIVREEGAMITGEGAGEETLTTPSSSIPSISTKMEVEGSKTELKEDSLENRDYSGDPQHEDEFLKVNTPSQSQHDFAAAATTAFDVSSSSPPLTFNKYLATMQEKQIPVSIRYSQVSGLRSFYLTAAKKITQSNPDVVVKRMILPAVEGESEASSSSLFEVLVDGRVIIGKGRGKWQPVSRNGNGVATSGMSVFISMQEVDAAIAKARRKRRPSTAYVRGAEEGGTPAIRLEMLKAGRDGKEEEHSE